MDLFLDDEVPQPIKKKLAVRMREVEKNLVSPGYVSTGPPQYRTPQKTSIQTSSPIITTQSPSMQRIMEANVDLIPKPPVPTTAEAAQALSKRQQILNGAANEKPEPGRTSPRKF